MHKNKILDASTMGKIHIVPTKMVGLKFVTDYEYDSHDGECTYQVVLGEEVACQLSGQPVMDRFHSQQLV